MEPLRWPAPGPGLSPLRALTLAHIPLFVIEILIYTCCQRQAGGSAVASFTMSGGKHPSRVFQDYPALPYPTLPYPVQSSLGKRPGRELDTLTASSPRTAGLGPIWWTIHFNGVAQPAQMLKKCLGCGVASALCSPHRAASAVVATSHHASATRVMHRNAGNELYSGDFLKKKKKL